MKVRLMPDYFSTVERVEYGDLYGISLPDRSIRPLFGQIRDKDEIGGLAFYSQIKGRKPIALIDEILLEYF